MREGWTKRKLGDVISLEYGKPLPNDQRCGEKGFPAYGANGIKCYAVKPFWEHPSIIVGRKGTAGAVNLVHGGFWPLDVTYYVTFNDNEYDLKFLYYMLCALNLPSLARGVKPGINRNVVYAIEQRFPTLPEQKRIVAILDEAFAGIDAAIANTEKNLANARALFESYLNSVFSEIGDEWVEKRLDDICTFSSGGTPSKGISSYWNGEIPWISGRDMKSAQLSDSLLHISQCAVDDSSTRIAPEGSLLILVRGMGLAHGAQVAELMVPCAFNQDIKGVHPASDLIPRYLVFALRYRINLSENVLSSAAHGTLKINMDELKNIMIPCPPKEQQRTIVASFNALIEETKRLESIYHQKLTALTELKQSLLKKAFAGELTAHSIEKKAREAMI